MDFSWQTGLFQRISLGWQRPWFWYELDLQIRSKAQSRSRRKILSRDTYRLCHWLDFYVYFILLLWWNLSLLFQRFDCSSNILCCLFDSCSCYLWRGKIGDRVITPMKTIHMLFDGFGLLQTISLFVLLELSKISGTVLGKSFLYLVLEYHHIYVQHSDKGLLHDTDNSCMWC